MSAGQPSPAHPSPAGDSLEAVARPKPTTEPERALWELAATVHDPEVPVLSIEDLGVLRAARVEDGAPVISITPTYSGCPAVDAMADDIVGALAAGGWPGARVEVVASPAWTTDWMSQAGRDSLRAYGIAPPCQLDCVLTQAITVRCPRCDSAEVSLVSRFGSTSCKALYECQGCHEPFEHFKAF